MIDLLKKTLAFGMGAAAFSAEKIKQFADDMVARGEITSEEAGKCVDDMTKRAEDEKRAVQDWVREQMSKMLQGMGAVESARVDALEQRIAALEEKLGVSAAEAKSEADAAGEC